MTAPLLDRARLQALCALARLQLPPDQEERVLARLREILNAFAALERAERAPAPPPATRDEAAPNCRLRADDPGRVLPRAEVLANAPAQAQGMFLVPRILEP